MKKYLVIFPSETDMAKLDTEFLGLGFFRAWLTRMEDLVIPRQAWIEFRGLPITAWSVKNFSELIGSKGQIYDVASVLSERGLLTNPRVLIETSIQGSLDSQVRCQFNDKLFEISMIERDGEINWAELEEKEGKEEKEDRNDKDYSVSNEELGRDTTLKNKDNDEIEQSIQDDQGNENIENQVNNSHVQEITVEDVEIDPNINFGGENLDGVDTSDRVLDSLPSFVIPQDKFPEDDQGQSAMKDDVMNLTSRNLEGGDAPMDSTLTDRDRKTGVDSERVRHKKKKTTQSMTNLQVKPRKVTSKPLDVWSPRVLSSESSILNEQSEITEEGSKDLLSTDKANVLTKKLGKIKVTSKRGRPKKVTKNSVNRCFQIPKRYQLPPIRGRD